MSKVDIMSDKGLACLLLLADFHKIPADGSSLSHEYDASGRDMDALELVRAARQIGFRAKLRNLNWDRLEHLTLPAMCRTQDGSWVIFARYGHVPGRDVKVCLLQWPTGRQETLEPASLREILKEEVLLLSPRAQNAESPSRFDLAWFVPTLVKHRWRVSEMLLASLVVHILGLAAPISFQVVMDKVLVHRAYETLVTIAVGFGLAVVMETLLGTLRGYFSAHLGCRMDAHIGSSVFRRLVHQPLQYFRSRSVGEIVQRLRELEAVRTFLVNGIINVVLDVMFIVVYLWVMWFYSPLLTKVMLVSLLAYVLVAVILGPVIRRRVQRQYESAAANQAFLVETVKAIQTVKASALEPRKKTSWERKLAEHAGASFQAGQAGNYGSNAVQLVSRLTTVALLALGALEVIEGNLTVGALVAFNMLSQRVAQPVLRMAQLWQELQQLRVALHRVSDLMESPIEQNESGIKPLSVLSGQIEFDKVRFRYPHRERDVLQDISLRVEPQQVVGIVGRSGSGKSSLVALLQRFYQPTAGRILVDNHNLVELQLPWLRRQLGVVLQDNELFNGTIRDNIAYANPTMSTETVIAAAQLACAHEFITTELGQGYQTNVGEGGALLSGGQRQRIAIARALANNPRLLILDEATSALDSESAATFRSQLPEICSGRTVFIITHNLDMLACCDLVIVMENGRIVEQGSREELLALGGRFTQLHNTGKL